MDWVDFDEALLPEDSWEGDLAEDEYEVEKISRHAVGTEDPVWADSETVPGTMEEFWRPILD